MGRGYVRLPNNVLPPTRYHDPEATLEEGLATLKRCIDEVAKRLVVAPGKYIVKVVDKDGVREVELGRIVFCNRSMLT